jgi:tRNA 5-methylaminomethyl-2-thiouridine biosynthesis bifunctional protein
MNANPPWQAAAAPELNWEGDQPHSPHFDDYYYSSTDGLEESQYVFLQGNDLPGAWQQRQRFTIAETGFGTGLNFLATWQAWQEQPGQCQTLHYISYEKFPLRQADLARALRHWPQLLDFSQHLLAAYPPPLPGSHRLSFAGGKIILDLIFADALEASEEHLLDPNLRVDCWFLDGFTPARNPDMWQPQVYQRMAQLSANAATFATFTAAGDVRRGLSEAGFNVNKASGYGPKREVCRGQLLQEPPPRPAPAVTPWHRHKPLEPAARHAIVVGAGLAGATVAAALARRDWRVTVLDEHHIGSGASGNRQGVLYTRLSHRNSDLNSFSVHSYSFALRLYQELLRSGALQPGSDGELCGALHALANWGPEHELFDTVQSLPELVRYLDPAASSAATGLADSPAGLWYPGAGWMQPAAICRALLSSPGIEVREQCGPLSLAAQTQGWGLLDANGSKLVEAEVAVVATGISSRQFAATDWLPLQSIRGQTTELASSGDLQHLRSVICHDGYIAPASDNSHCIGATFDIDDAELTTRTADHRRNLDALERALPALNLQQDATQAQQGWVGFRCASPDYLPMAGPVPDRTAFIDTFAALRRNARRVIAEHGPYLRGLYLSTAHGSRGLTSTPLAAEMLAAQICGEPLPVPTALARALNPARFLIRGLARNRI